MAHEIIKSYFYLYSNKIEKATGLRRLRIKSRRSKTNRIFLSRLNLKHTSTNVLISVYVYNRQNIYLNNKLKQLDLVTELIRSITCKQSTKNIKTMWLNKYYETTVKNEEIHIDINDINSKVLDLVKKIQDQKKLLGTSII